VIADLQTKGDVIKEAEKLPESLYKDTKSCTRYLQDMLYAGERYFDMNRF